MDMSSNSSEIAVIGMSGEFPGAKNSKEFWNNLMEGRESIHTFSPSELSNAGISNEVWKKPNYVPRAGLLKDIEHFAAEFFGYSPREASLMDPQQRKLLEHAWHACEDGAINPLQYEGIIGVFVGSSLNTYLINNVLTHPDMRESDDMQHALFGNGVDYLATKIAYQLNCKGPALTIQTACSTSLVAVHEACQQLLTWQVDVALAGGVSISVPQEKGYLHGVDGIFSSDGHCRPFSSDANGTLFSNGLGVVVLKRLEDAIADGNPIYAVIKGSAINNDGHQKVGYTAPSVEGQCEVIAMAQAAANISADDVFYIEAHGTGTALGDPIELSALNQAFADAKQPCTLGSLKSNVGHLDVASGIAGLIKTILVLANQQIPPTINFQKGTNQFDWKNSVFEVNKEAVPVENIQKRYAAAVSSFGIGGTNAHVVLAHFAKRPVLLEPLKRHLLCFSAKTTAALEDMLQQFVEQSESLSSFSLESIARTLQEGRSLFRYRTVLKVGTLQEAIFIIQNKGYAITSCEKEQGYLRLDPIESCDDKALDVIAQQWLDGYAIDWKSHYSNYKPVMVHLPVYPFERKPYWIAPFSEQKEHVSFSEMQNNARLTMDDWFYQPSWKPAPYCVISPPKVLNDVLILINKDMDLLYTSALAGQFDKPIVVYTSNQFKQINESNFEIDPHQAAHFIQLLQALHQQNRIPNYILHGLTLTQTKTDSSPELFKAHQPFGLLSIIYLVQAWEKVFQDRALQFTVLTNRLNRIAEAMNEPHKAPILAAVKVIPKEYLSIQSQLVDIDCIDYHAYQSQQMKQLAQEMARSEYTHEEIVLRGMSRWLRTYVPIEVPALKSNVFTGALPKVILIAGGLGQLGLNIASFFAQFPNTKLALVARKTIPKPTDWESSALQYDTTHPMRLLLEKLIDIRKQGCELHTYSADISNKDNLLACIQTIESTLGPINGVIHAAGETVNGIVSIKTESSLEESYQAKVYGTYHLCEAFSSKSLDFMMLCSSMNAVIGGLGQLDNTAANTCIDYLADYYTALTGRPFLSINWGAINMDNPLKVNVVPQFAQLSAEHKRNRMTEAETRAVYSILLSNQLCPRVVISTLPMEDVLLNWNRVASFKQLDNDVLISKPLNLEEDALKTQTQRWIAASWSRLLGVESIGLTTNFFSLGGHSLSAVQFMTRILEEHGLKIHVMTLYELPTLAEFSGYMDNLKQQKQAFVE